MDHHQFDEDVLDKGTQAILRTRDGLLRAAVPSPLGSCVFLNDVSMQEMFAALRKHKEVMKSYPRNGEGLEAFVDASDTGYTMNGIAAEYTNGATNGMKVNVINDDSHKNTNGVHVNGTNGVKSKTIGIVKKHASGPEGVDGLQNGVANTTITNGWH